MALLEDRGGELNAMCSVCHIVGAHTKLVVIVTIARKQRKRKNQDVCAQRDMSVKASSGKLLTPSGSNPC